MPGIVNNKCYLYRNSICWDSYLSAVSLSHLQSKFIVASPDYYCYNTM